LTPQQTELVRCVAEEGGGQLFGAENAAELGQALTTALGETGVPVTPAPQLPAPSSLADIRTLTYHQLTQWITGVDPAGERAPILSDDGQVIAFTRDPGSGDPANPNRIFVMNADGSGEREIDAYQTLCYCGSMIDISGDGSTVVSSDAVQLRIADANGGGGRELVRNSSNEINAVRISGDGRTVVFRIYRSNQQFERGIWAINADGTGLRQVVGPAQMGPLLGVAAEEAPFFGGTSGLDVSANGGQIVFTSYADVDPATGSAREALFAVNSDGSNLHRLLGATFTYVLANGISGDGSTVAYITGDFATGRQEAGVVSFDGSGQRTLTDNTTPHPGTGNNLPSGERIQLNADGSRLLLGSTGLLFDTRDGAQLALGLEIPPAPGQRALVPEGLPVATMNSAAMRLVYLFQPAAGPLQLARLDLNPAEVVDVPLISEARVDPNYVLIQGRSSATVSARVSPLEPAPWVGGRVLRNGLPDDASFSRVALVDDGTTGGDTAASDGVFTNSLTTCCDQVGLRVVRVQAERVTADGLQQAMAVDIAPFAVVADRADAPEPGTPAPTTVIMETPPPTAPPPTTAPPTGIPPAPTPPTAAPGQGVPGPGGELTGAQPPAPTVEAPSVPPTTAPQPPIDPAQATIAAQATLIAELQGATPTPVP
jgi:Tol biopolymer transport system component